VVNFGVAHWAELIRPQRWAGERACSPEGKARQGRTGGQVGRVHWYVSVVT